MTDWVSCMKCGEFYPIDGECLCGFKELTFGELGITYLQGVGKTKDFQAPKCNKWEGLTTMKSSTRSLSGSPVLMDKKLWVWM